MSESQSSSVETILKTLVAWACNEDDPEDRTPLTPEHIADEWIDEALQAINKLIEEEVVRARIEMYDQALYDSGYLQDSVGPKTKELVISTREKLRNQSKLEGEK